MGAFKFTVDQVQQAAALVIDSQFGSTAMLIRRLAVGVGTAGAIMSRLHELGIVGPVLADGSRRVLVAAVRKQAALACIVGGHRYDPNAPVVAGRDAIGWAAMAGAVGIAYSAMPENMRDDLARETAEKIVGLLADAGWRPLAPVAG